MNWNGMMNQEAPNRWVAWAHDRWFTAKTAGALIKKIKTFKGDTP